MSADTFHTSAGNFNSALNSSVDPRTGLFKINMPLAKLHANYQLGPELSLNLFYSPLSTTNVGFGKGFSLNLSQYHQKMGKLQLSTGEEYRVGSNDKVKQQKLKNFLFSKLDDGSYQIVYKSGMKERLSLRSGGIYVTTEISSADGRSIKLVWDSQFSTARLTQVTDNNDHILCSIAYPNVEIATTRFTLLPNVAELSHTTTFRFKNELLTRISTDAIDPALVWEFQYDDIGPQKLYRAITEIKTSTGLVEKIVYSSQEGMEFPEVAKLPALPRVHRHTVKPGCGQPRVITTWKYTQKNYLGKGATFASWLPNHDHMLNILIRDYHYGSTEQHTDDSGNVISSVTRRYNSYHLLVSEVTARNGKKHTKETEYYARAGVKFDNQPTQYALPKIQTEIWTDKADESKSHSVVMKLEFDENGNPLRQESPEGAVTEITYYAPAGEGDLCPADPHGFLRYQKMQTVTPPQIRGNEVATITKFVWQKLDALNGSGYAVVQKSKDQYKGTGHNLINNVYHTYHNVPTIYGRVRSQQSTFTPDTSKAETKFTNTRNFTYVIDANRFTQRNEFIGHDGLTTVDSQVQDMWTGQVKVKTLSTGVEIRYDYDKLGRVMRRSVCPDSIYENNSTWEYVIGKDGLYTIENDHDGNATKTRCDFAGRSLSQHRFNTETNAWYELSSTTHNSLGEIVSATVSDWQTGSGNDGNKRFPLTSDITYDGWGEKKKIFFSNDKTQHEHYDFIQLIQTTFEEGGSDAHRLITASVTKTYDQVSGHLINKSVKNGSGELYSSCQYTWDGLGQLLEEQDELGQITKRTYDEYGRVVTQTLADGTVLSRTYAPHSTGKFVSSISVTGRNADGENQTWVLGTQKFDSLGRVTESIIGGRKTLNTYQGALAKPTVVTLPSGKALNYTYIPELGNVISSMQTVGITQTFNYDKVSGQLLTARESNAEIQYTYSNDGRLTKETFINDGSTKVAQHVQTLNGTPVTYIDVNGKQTQHIMNAHGQLTRTDDENLTVDFSYDALARLSTKTVRDKSSSSTLTTKLEYDELGQERRRAVNDQNGLSLVVSQTAGDGAWHAVKDGKTRIWGADVEIAHADVKALHSDLVATIPKERRILILSGVHGAEDGRNYLQRGESIMRRKYLKEFQFLHEDVNLVDHRTMVVDAHGMDYIERIQWMCGDYEVILGYCFGRNDQALRYTFDLPPVTSYVRDFWTN
ncbi:hypothetical protein HA402_012818 [Bradysia odoriphaga]|nr:hypothetical protein HA402_012818 [Bradysia odoriphaga]